jgi:hypothetical protein
VKCYNCDKNALYAVGPDGQQAPLCLDCYIRWQNAQLQQQEMLERELNYLSAEMESIAGVSGILPIYPARRTVIHTGGVTLNNIHVSNSEVGVLNTGTIGNVDATVTVLKSEGNAQLASAVAALSEAVIKSGQISNDSKNQILELLGALSEEAVVLKEKRKSSVAKALLVELSGILGAVSALAGLWATAKGLFEQLFG